MLDILCRFLVSWPLCLYGIILSLFRRKNNPMVEDVDFVVLWVDEKDTSWQAVKKEWSDKLMPDNQANAVERFRDWDNFHYWFRAVEKNAPWVYHVVCPYLLLLLHVSRLHLFIQVSSDHLFSLDLYQLLGCCYR